MKAKILIVDDEPVLLRLVGYALHKEGYETVVAQQGEEALGKVKTERPDLVILDIMLPDMDGIEICRRLRARPETTTLPIMMLSARGQVPDKVMGLRAGADEYMTKPIHPEELVARVEALLERTRRLRQTRQGKAFGFIGAKGGVGTTTVALNIAVALAKREKATIAVELRPYFGTFSLQLGQAPTQNLGDLLALEPEAIDERELTIRLANHSTGLRTLFGPQKINQYRGIRPDQAEAVITGLIRIADYTIVDLPCYPSSASQAALRHCDFVVLVMEPEPGCVQAAKMTLEMLQSWGVSGGLVGSVIVNRTASAMSLKSDEISSQLDCSIIGVVPLAAEACLSSQKRGVPFVVSQPDNPASANLVELADKLSSRSAGVIL
jgi:DNA-binding response OmpR family regulator